MSNNSFGSVFKITTWGESHGPAIGVVIDGCPAGIEIAEDEINQELAKRAPGKNPLTSPRKEDDKVQILSGTFEGKTTGAPISLLIQNKDQDKSKYEPIKNLCRPGHANFTYLEKYGIFDYQGGGRASARETACRVAAGAIAKKFLIQYGITTNAKLISIGPISTDNQKAFDLLESAKNEGDSLPGIVEFTAIGVPPGLGDPVYQKLDAKLSFAMMSIPASKGVEIGDGFNLIELKGSDSNDLFTKDENGKIITTTNHSGGILGGISNGMPIVGRVIFKATSSIKKPQETISLSGEKEIFQLPEGSRHDPCVAIRATPVVESMLALVLADALLLNRLARSKY